MIEVKLHDIGEGITEGEVLHYLVQEGDQVSADQPLVEIQTDKVLAELPSPCAGKVRDIVIPAGQTVQVGTTLLYIEAEGTKPLKTEPPTQQKPSTSSSSSAGFNQQTRKKANFRRILATPYTRKIAREHQINIEDVPAADPSGRVMEEDIYRFIEEQQKEERQSFNGIHQSLGTTRQRGPNPAEDSPGSSLLEENLSKEPTNLVNPLASQQTEREEIPFRGIRKQIAKKMTQSLFTIPHVAHFSEVDMSNLFKLRETWKRANISISITSFFVKALVQALKEFPIFNSELDEEREKIILKKEYHIGLATDTKEGLVVPVIRHAHIKSMTEIDADIKRLTEKAKKGKLQREDVHNGTFTISNVGPLGGSIFATPIINYPQTALLAFHQTRKMPVVNEQDEIVIRQIMTLSFVFDHRVADGASATAFTNRFSLFIEQPNLLMLKLS